MKSRKWWLVLAAVGFLVLTNVKLGKVERLPAATPADHYTLQIQPLFDQRCIACHGCYNSPCQLNLQSFDGLSRGASKDNPYDFGKRLKGSVEPTRMWIDAKSSQGWREKGFFDAAGLESSDSILTSLLEQRIHEPNQVPEKSVETSWNCPRDKTELAKSKVLTGGMPFGLPPITQEQYQSVQDWLKSGAPGPVLPAEDSGIARQITQWETFLNRSESRQPLVSRYLYEHLFLAHLHFAGDHRDSPLRFYRMVRSARSCHEGGDEIATRRANDDPRVARVYYCVRPVRETIVEKSHMPYELSAAKLNRLQTLFFSGQWEAGAMPAYGAADAANPFITFKSIPAQSRYQFLLDDAQYHVSTFIKGPVCRGNTAVSSIQEQFYAFFLAPGSDPIVRGEGGDALLANLGLTQYWGSDVAFSSFEDKRAMVDSREKYRAARYAAYKTLHPKGYDLSDLWDGDQTNDNAVLTIFRHFDSAFVAKGAVGDISKTGFVIDYSLFERLIYNLAVGYDLFASTGHQYLTRFYMAMIRMESEELFLEFLPQGDRRALWNSWYRGVATKATQAYRYAPTFNDVPTAVNASWASRNAEANKSLLIRKILFERMNAKVRGPFDNVNWKQLTASSHPENPLYQLAGLKLEDGPAPLIGYMPDFALLAVTDSAGAIKDVYSVVRNKEMKNLSWIVLEGLFDASLRDYGNDSLIIYPGRIGSYPNLFYFVRESDLPTWVASAKGPGTIEQWRDFERSAIQKSHPQFWSYYDSLSAFLKAKDPIHGGVLDLTRYGVISEQPKENKVEAVKKWIKEKTK